MQKQLILYIMIGKIMMVMRMNKLKKTRIALGITQDEASDILGISRRTYQKYEQLEDDLKVLVYEQKLANHNQKTLNIKFDDNKVIDYLKHLLSIDSTTGKCFEIEEDVYQIVTKMGYYAYKTHKGGLIVEVGGEGNPLVVTGHLDDIGLMVRNVNNNGSLKVCTIGGLYANYCLQENVRVYTRDNHIYHGTICRYPNSVHVTEDEIRKNVSDFNTNVCIVLDEDVKSKEDVLKLGITTGDIIALDPKTVINNGYIKSRFIDDKAACAIMLYALEELKNIKLNRKIYFYFGLYEEIGHGTSYLPTDTKDILAIDIAPTGDEQTTDLKKVSIFAKDSRFPYHYQMTNELRQCAINNGIDYVVDVFTPHYGTDCDTSIVAGYDVRHAAIGFGCDNSHGYERCHIEGLKQTYALLMSYIKSE